jgi:hypothetical protein
LGELLFEKSLALDSALVERFVVADLLTSVGEKDLASRRAAGRVDSKRMNDGFHRKSMASQLAMG